MYAHFLWILPVQSAIIAYLMYNRIGWAALVGVGCLLLNTIPVQSYLSGQFARLRLLVALKTDERVGFMHEIVHGIQVIKMYAWERFFQSTVLKVREQELRQVLIASYIRSFNMLTSIFSERALLFVTIVLCAFIGQATPTDVVFSVMQYFSILQVRYNKYFLHINSSLKSTFIAANCRNFLSPCLGTWWRGYGIDNQN